MVRYAIGAHDFAAEMHQANVVSNMSVRQKNAIDSKLALRWSDGVKPLKLFAKIRCTFEQPLLATHGIDDRQTNSVSPLFRVGPSARNTAFDSQPEDIPRLERFPRQLRKVHLATDCPMRSSWLQALAGSLDVLHRVSLGSSYSYST